MCAFSPGLGRAGQPNSKTVANDWTTDSESPVLRCLSAYHPARVVFCGGERVEAGRTGRWKGVTIMSERNLAVFFA